jgi:hypothetical protein
MEMSQGNTLCSYLYLKQAKMSFFLFFFFPATKSENRRVEQVLWGRGKRLVPVGGGGGRKGG